MSGQRVPFVDLRPQASTIWSRVLDDLADLADTAEFAGGPPVALFEHEFAMACCQGYAAGVGSGLDALRLTLMTLTPRVRRVIVPALTFTATWEAVAQAGHELVPVDVGDDGLIDVAHVEAALCEDVTVVVPVHLHGHMADVVGIDRVVKNATGPTVWVFEDAAQAFGANRDLTRPGELAHAVTFSFYPTKPLGGWGDGGAVVTSNGWIDSRVRSLRAHGAGDGPDTHDRPGYTSRLDTVQAVVLRAALDQAEEWRLDRERLANRYLDFLDETGDLYLPAPEGRSAWHVFAVRTELRDELQAYLAARGIGTRSHYPIATSSQRAWRDVPTRPGGYPVAERIAAETLSLPLWAGMTDVQQDYVLDEVTRFFT